MDMKRFICFLLFVLVLFACEKQEKGYDIEANITGVSDGVEVILLTENEEIADTTWVKNNTFSFKGKTASAVMSVIKIGQHIIKFPLDNDELHFEITVNKNINFQLEYGNLTIRENLNRYMDETSANYLKAVKRTPLDRVDSLALVFLSQLEKEYVSKKDKSGLAIILVDLTKLIGTKNHPQKINELYTLLPEHEKSGYYGKKVRLFLEQKKHLSEKRQIDFEYVDIKGNAGTVNQFKGNYVLIEFWASWCSPCKITIPYIKALEMNRDNLSVVAVSVDHNVDAWKDEITKMEIHHWTNIHFNQDAVNLKQLFSVTSVPYNILLDPQGYVVGENYDVNQLKKIFK